MSLIEQANRRLWWRVGKRFAVVATVAGIGAVHAFEVVDVGDVAGRVASAAGHAIGSVVATGGVPTLDGDETEPQTAEARFGDGGGAAAAVVEAGFNKPIMLPGPDGKSRIFPGREAQCMARAVYYESGDASDEVRIGIAQVVLNRWRSKEYGGTVCQTVHRGMSGRLGCLFVRTCRNVGEIPSDIERWRAALAITRDVITGARAVPDLKDASHFYRRTERPVWRGTVYPITEIDAMIFAGKDPIVGFDPATKAAAASASITRPPTTSLTERVPSTPKGREPVVEGYLPPTATVPRRAAGAEALARPVVRSPPRPPASAEKPSGERDSPFDSGR